MFIMSLKNEVLDKSIIIGSGYGFFYTMGIQNNKKDWIQM